MLPQPKIQPIPLPPLPQVLAPLSVPPADLARDLIKKLSAGERSVVMSDVRKLSLTDLDALERELPRFSRDKRTVDKAYELRRIIRFVRNPPKTPPAPGPKIPSRTLGPPNSEIPLDVPHTGAVSLHVGRREGEYLLTYKGPAGADMRWLQFIWRMAVLHFPATHGSRRSIPLKMRLDRFSGIPFRLTTDPKKPRWFTDTSAAGGGFYEQDTTVERKTGEFRLYDSPSPLPAQHLTDVFGWPNPPEKIVASFRAATYLVDGLDVLYRADVHLEWDYARPSKVPSSFKTISANGLSATELEPEHRACLLRHYPHIDYLPGKLIGGPQPAYEFDPIPDLAPSGWDTKNDGDRYLDIAELAHAEWVVDDLDINMMPQVYNPVDPNPRRTYSLRNIHLGATPGLNMTRLSDKGKVSFLGSRDIKIPQERVGKLPSVVLELGESTFRYGKEVRQKSAAIATLRHEMMHVAQHEMAIGWLLKWRDEITAESFENWLRAQRQIGPIDRTVILTYVADPVDRSATEVLAYTEGFVAAVPFLPPKPDFKAHMDTLAMWPGAIDQLAGEASTMYDLLRGRDGEAVRVVAAKRRREVICGHLTQVQRDAIVAWVEFLLDPEKASHVPPPPRTVGQDDSLSKIKKLSRKLLKDLLADAKKRCPT